MLTKVTPTNERGKSASNFNQNEGDSANVSREELKLSLETCVQDTQKLVKRGRRKYLSAGLSLALVDACRQNEQSTLEKSYWNTFHCCGTLTEYENGALAGKYCKTRWCMVCSSIRIAKAINKYLPVIEKWESMENLYFVTLTKPTTESKYLKAEMRIRNRMFQKIKKKMDLQFRRGQRPRLQGIRKTECTYRIHSNEFHPHYHLLVRGERNANDLVKYWLECFADASPGGQDVRKADQNSAMELFKYFAKVINNDKGKRVIYADALDVMFNAMKGIRVFKSFGMTEGEKSIMGEDLEKSTAKKILNNLAIGEYIWQGHDWVKYKIDHSTGEVLRENKLTGYEPVEGMKNLIEKKIIVRKNHNWNSNRYK